MLCALAFNLHGKINDASFYPMSKKANVRTEQATAGNVFLTPEIALHILHYLDNARDIRAAMLTNHHLYTLVQHEPSLCEVILKGDHLLKRLWEKGGGWVQNKIKEHGWSWLKQQVKIAPHLKLVWCDYKHDRWPH